MPLYLLHQDGDGTPVGVYTEDRDYYRPEDYQLREQGRSVVYGKLASAPWDEFAEKLADMTPSPTGRWDTFFSSSRVLESVLNEARANTSTGA